MRKLLTYLLSAVLIFSSTVSVFATETVEDLPSEQVLLEEETPEEVPGSAAEELTAENLEEEVTIKTEPEDLEDSSVTLKNESELSDISGLLINSIRAGKKEVDVSSYNINIDLSNGCHILSDYQDDLFYEYAEDSFCVENLTFVQENGKLLSVKINYTDSAAEIAKMKAAISSRLDEIVAEVEDIEDETEKIGKVSELIWKNYYDDFSSADIRINDVYGCLVRGYASRFGAAISFQAAMNRLGYEGGYYLSGADIYSKNKIGDEWKYTNIAWNQSRKNNTYLLTDVTESNRTYSKQALTENEYTPISMFSDNPYLWQKNENSQYLAEQVLKGETEITLPNPVYYNYRKGYTNYITNVRHEYPDAGFLFNSTATSVKNNIMTVKPNYMEESSVREEMLKSFHDEVSKIVSRANKFKTPEEKIIFVNNYITKTTTYKEYEDGVKLPYSHDAYGCLVNGECVCEGYATAFHMIMKELGIDDTYVQSYNHIWNKVYLNGEYKIIDATNNGSGNRYLLADIHDANVHPNGSLDLSRYIYVLNNTLSMASSSTKYIVNELSKGTTHIDTSNINFWLDRRSKNFDVNWYIDTLKNAYPVEMRDVDTMEFNTEGDNILSIDVTYKERTNEDIEAFETVVNNIVNSASEKSTEEEKVAAVMSGIYKTGIKGSTSGEEDVVTTTLTKSGTYLAKTRLCCYILEKLGIRYTVIKDRNVYYYTKNVYDGVVRYSSPVLSGYINLEEIKSYDKFKDYPFYDFTDPDKENAYIDGENFNIVLDTMYGAESVPSDAPSEPPTEPDTPPTEPDTPPTDPDTPPVEPVDPPVEPILISLNTAAINLSKDSFVYNNEVQIPQVSISYDGKKLKENTDYTVQSSQSKEPGTYTISITGTGEYKDTVLKEYVIRKAPSPIKNIKVSNVDVDTCKLEWEYNGNVTVTYDSKTLTATNNCTIKGIPFGKILKVQLSAGSGYENSAAELNPTPDFKPVKVEEKDALEFTTAHKDAKYYFAGRQVYAKSGSQIKDFDIVCEDITASGVYKAKVVFKNKYANYEPLNITLKVMPKSPVLKSNTQSFTALAMTVGTRTTNNNPEDYTKIVVKISEKSDMSNPIIKTCSKITGNENTFKFTGLKESTRYYVEAYIEKVSGGETLRSVSTKWTQHTIKTVPVYSWTQKDVKNIIKLMKKNKSFTYKFNGCYNINDIISFLSNILIDYPQYGQRYQQYLSYQDDCITVEYRYNTKEAWKYKKAEKVINSIVKGAKKKKGTRAKVKYINSRLCKICRYKKTSDSHSIYGCLVQGKAVCNGYAMAFKAIAVQCGIPNVYATSPNHIWNKVKIGKTWYHVDVTWNDTCGKKTKYLLTKTHK